MRQEEAKRVLEAPAKRNRDDDEDSGLQDEKAQGNTTDITAKCNQWSPSDVNEIDIRKVHGNLYHPLLTPTGDVVSMHPETLQIGNRSEQKLRNFPRFNGKVLRCPGYYYVLDSETKAEVSVYPHIRMLGYFLLYKLTRYLDSTNVKLSVNVLIITCFIMFLIFAFR